MESHRKSTAPTSSFLDSFCGLRCNAEDVFRRLEVEGTCFGGDNLDNASELVDGVGADVVVLEVLGGVGDKSKACKVDSVGDVDAALLFTVDVETDGEESDATEFLVLRVGLSDDNIARVDA